METRNVHQRKLAVMRKCAEIAADKTHPAHKFQYVSIQNVSNHLRTFCADEGLDIVTSISDGQVVIELVNVDSPNDKIVSNWPIVQGDKGYAYSIKFPLIRLFLIGDGEEADEAEMATNSGRATNGHKAKPAPAPVVAGEYGVGDECPACIRMELEGRDVRLGRFKVAAGGQFKGQLQCTGKVDGEWANHLAPITKADEDRVEALAASGDIDPNTIPF